MRFPGFEEKWKEKTLEQLANIYDGTHQTPKYVSSGIPFVSVENIENIENTNKYISENAFEKFTVKPQKDDILMTRITAGIIGATAVVKDNNPLGYYVSLALIRKKNNSTDVNFLEKYINSNYFKRELHKRIIHIAFPKKINLGEIRYCKICHPHSEEQRKIASFLSVIDLRIATQNKIIEDYKLLKEGMMQKIFKQELRFKDEDGNNYSEWKKLKLADILYEHKLRNKGNQFCEVFSVSKEKGIINQIEHLGRSYSAESIEHYKLIEPHDITYTKSPTSGFPYGIIKQNQTERIGVLSPLYGVFRPKNPWIGTIIHSYFLSSVNTYNYLNPLVHKGAKNTMNINNDTFLNGAKIKLPIDEKEQQKIASVLSSLDKKIKLETEQLTNFEVQKQYFLQNLFV